MKLLMAAPDRDLLMTYKKLFELDSYEVTTAFDGTQVVNKLSENTADFVILDRTLPRVDHSVVMKLIHEKKLPVIVLLRRKVTPQILLSSETACSYMNFPFFPGELREKVAEVREMAECNEMLSAGGLDITVKDFACKEGVRFTCEEINVLKALTKNESFDVRPISSYINSLNNKFERLKKSARIKYIMNEGYRLVNEYE